MVSITKDNDSEGRPDYGHRLIPNVLEERAASGYTRPLVSLPRSNDPKDGFRDISYQQFVNAVNRCCWLLDGKLGQSKNFDTFAYLGPSDVRYLLLYIAAMKTLRKVFMPSPRNSLADQLILLEQVNSEAILIPQDPLPMVTQILASSQMVSIPLPTVDELFEDTIVPHYRYDKTYEQAKRDPFAILHTSGSTGTPKPITIRHTWTSQLDKYQDYDRFGFGAGQAALTRERRVFMAFPLFHSAGVLYGLNANTWYESTNVFAPPVPLTADVANGMHVHANVDVTAVVPSIIMDLAKNPEYFENLSRLKVLIFAGGPISTSVGNEILSKTYLFNSIGATECGLWTPEIKDDPNDWEYYKFNEFNGFEFREVSPGQYEAFVVQDPKLEPCQPVFETLPDLNGEYRTKDIYSKHPTKTGLWKYEGRADDIIVFNNGEKLNPVSMEHRISTHPEVNGALIVGQGQFQPALIIEPVSPVKDPEEENQLLEKAWPVIQDANRAAVAHGRISKDYVISTSEEKPFLRAGKGTIQRQQTLALYRDEIEKLYENEGRGASGYAGDIKTLQEMEEYVMGVVESLTEFKDLDETTDLFQRGMDSLQVINLVKEINIALGPKTVSSSSIYNNPSVSKIANNIYHGENQDDTTNHIEDMQSIFESFSLDIPICSKSYVKPHWMTVIVTGTTGSLGSYLIRALLQSEKVNKIYCLNRSKDAKARHKQLWGTFDLSLESPRVKFLQTDFSKSNFGLDPSSYEELLRSTTHIIHNAWPVDFNIPISSYADTHIRGVRQLIDFSAQSKFGASIFFVSTISAVFNWQYDIPVTESFLDDWNLPEPMGYSESKFVSERLLQRASSMGGIDAAVCRVGQIAGPVFSGTKGIWNKREWLPSIIASSKYMGKIPADLGPMEAIDWIPVDVLAQVMVELISDKSVQGDFSKSRGAMYHAANPRHSSWKSLLPTILANLSGNDEPEVVSFSEWIDTLRSYSETESENAQNNPAIKLMSFFEENAARLQSESGRYSGWPTLSTEKTCAESETLRALEAVGPEWMALWMKQWQF